MHKKFTARFLEHIKRPADGFETVFDTEVSGLHLRVPARADISFCVLGRSPDGRQKRVRIAIWCPFGGLDLFNGDRLDVDQLRVLAKQVKLNVLNGRPPFWQPGDDDKPAAPSITLDEAYKLLVGGRSLSHLTLISYENVLKLYLADWRTRALSSITRKEVYERHRLLSTAGGKRSKPLRGSANLTLRTFRACWNRGLKQEPELGPCPTVNVTWNRLKPRDYGLRAEHLPDLHAAILDVENEVTRDYWLALLFTGLRRRSAGCIGVEHVDIKAGVLHVAVAKGGEGKAFDLPITRQLAAVLKRRLAHANKAKSPWLFPAASESGHLEEPRLSTLPAPHALRKLYASVAALLVPAYALKKLLNHAVNMSDVTEHYVHLSAKDLLPHAQAVADKIDALTKAKPKKKAKAKPAASSPFRNGGDCAEAPPLAAEAAE